MDQVPALHRVVWVFLSLSCRNVVRDGFCPQPAETFPLRDLSFRLSGLFEGRAKIEGATVTLQRVTQDDAGEYRCEISAPLDSVSLGETNVTLKVLGKDEEMPSIAYTPLRRCLALPEASLSYSAAAHAVMRRPRLGGDGLGGAAALPGPAEHPARHVPVVQGRQADEPASPRQRHLLHQRTHGDTGEEARRPATGSVSGSTRISFFFFFSASSSGV